MPTLQQINIISYVLMIVGIFVDELRWLFYIGIALSLLLSMMSYQSHGNTNTQPIAPSPSPVLPPSAVPITADATISPSASYEHLVNLGVVGIQVSGLIMAGGYYGPWKSMLSVGAVMLVVFCVWMVTLHNQRPKDSAIVTPRQTGDDLL